MYGKSRRRLGRDAAPPASERRKTNSPDGTACRPYLCVEKIEGRKNEPWKESGLHLGPNFDILPSIRGLFQKGKAWGWAMLLLLAIPMVAKADFTNGNFTYTINWPEFYLIPYDGPWHYTATTYLGSSGEVTIPGTFNGDPVTKVGQQIFYNCQSIPNKVTISDNGWFWDIAGAAFSFCSNLTNVVFLGIVTNIGAGAFYSCTKLTNIPLPNNYWISIGSLAFSRSGLGSVTIPRSVYSIGEGAFSGCTSLTAITVQSNYYYWASVDGVLFNTNITTIVQYPAGKNGAYSIPDSVKSITGYAFDGVPGSDRHHNGQ